jgi:hypothetical protein
MLEPKVSARVLIWFSLGSTSMKDCLQQRMAPYACTMQLRILQRLGLMLKGLWPPFKQILAEEACKEEVDISCLTPQGLPTRRECKAGESGMSKASEVSK